jgi:hypothetical protein
MEEEPGFWVVGVFGDSDDLVGNVVKGGAVVEAEGVFRIEGLGHVEAIEPHLPGITFFVPEAAVLGAGVRGQLGAEEFCGFAVPFLAGHAVEAEDGFAGSDMVDVVIIELIAVDGTIGLDKGADQFFHIGLVTFFAQAGVQLEECVAEEPAGIIPFCTLEAFVVQTVALTGDFGVGHPDRPLQGRGSGEVSRVFLCTEGLDGKKQRTDKQSEEDFGGKLVVRHDEAVRLGGESVLGDRLLILGSSLTQRLQIGETKNEGMFVTACGLPSTLRYVSVITP